MVDHYVYVLKENWHTGMVKIGFTTDIQGRIDTLQIGNPRELVLVTKLGPMTRYAAIELENFYHRRFRKQRVRGEWFTRHVLKVIFEKPSGERQKPSLAKPEVPATDQYVPELTPEQRAHMRSI